MRGDVLIKQVLNKCEALKDARAWTSEPKLRPRAWLANFDEADRPIAAILLDRFTFFSNVLTESLLISSFSSLGDGTPKGPLAPTRETLVGELPGGVFTRVDGELPRPTDSGNLFCRMARQTLGIPDSRFAEPGEALRRAATGVPVVFLDDFIGSGDQFAQTWERECSDSAPRSFSEAMANRPFTAAYVTLVATDFGLAEIGRRAPHVAVAKVHVLGEESTFR